MTKLEETRCKLKMVEAINKQWADLCKGYSIHGQAEWFIEYMKTLEKSLKDDYIKSLESNAQGQ